MNRLLAAIPLSICLPIVSCSLVARDPDQQRALELRRETARMRFDEGNLAAASNMASLALEIDPNDWLALSILGMSKARLGAAAGDARTQLRFLNEAVAAYEKAETSGGARDRFQIQFGHGTTRAMRARLCLSLVEEGEKRLAEAGPGPAGVDEKEHKDYVAKVRNEIERYKTTAAADLEIAENRLEQSLQKSEQQFYIETYEHMQTVHALRNRHERVVEWGAKVADLIVARREVIETQLKNPGLPGSVTTPLRQELIRLDAREANSRSLSALSFSRLGKPQKAILELNRVIVIDPERPAEYFNRGVCKQMLGDYENATRDYETFIRKSRLASGDPVVRDAWNRINDCKKQIPGAGAMR